MSTARPALDTKEVVEVEPLLDYLRARKIRRELSDIQAIIEDPHKHGDQLRFWLTYKFTLAKLLTEGDSRRLAGVCLELAQRGRLRI